MSRTRAVLVALLLSTVGLAGCTDDDPEPAPPLPTTEAPTSPSATGTPGPEVPTMPAEARERTDAGAEAFVRYFIDVLNHAQLTGETSNLASISGPKCLACNGYVKGIRKAYDSGGRIEGGALKIGPLRRLPDDYGADWGGFASGAATPQVIYDGNGGRESFDGGRFSLYAYTKWRSGSWSMQWMRTPA